MVRHSAVFLCSLLVCGCASLEAQPPLVANQVADLKDQDSDGVINARDNCPNTPLGSVVDNDGCPTQSEQDNIQDLHVLFEHDKSVIRPEYMAGIEKTANFMKSNSGLTLVLEGHASQVGSDEHNQALSQRRAAAVKEVMIKQYGIEASRVILKPFAASHPAIEGHNQQADAVNRRVVGSLLATSSELVKKWTIFSVEQGF